MARAFVETQAFLRGYQPAPLAQEQGKPDLFLQRRNQPADLGLRAVDTPRGFGDAAGFHHGAQGLQAVQTHREKPEQWRGVWRQAKPMPGAAP
ncbi:hypothetical protein D3C77_715430 [compost metagenome]